VPLQGPLYTFVYMMVKPCTSLFVLAFGIGFPMYFSYAAVAEGGFKAPVIDMDLANYMATSDPVKWIEDAVTTAVARQSQSMPEAKPSSRRLQLSRFSGDTDFDNSDFPHDLSTWTLDASSTTSLKDWDTTLEVHKEGSTHRRLDNLMQTEWGWTLELFYQAKDGSTGIFTSAALDEIRQFEKDFLDISGWDKQCLVYHPNNREVRQGAIAGSCQRPATPILIFYPTRIVEIIKEANGNNRTRVSNKYNGKGNLTDIKETLRTLVRSNAQWWTDKDFSATNLKSQYTRSQVFGGSPVLKGTPSRKSFLQQMFDKKLKPKMGLDSLQHIIVSWYNTDLQAQV